LGLLALGILGKKASHEQGFNEGDLEIFKPTFSRDIENFESFS
jgi:hypothetical protein